MAYMTNVCSLHNLYFQREFFLRELVKNLRCPVLKAPVVHIMIACQGTILQQTHCNATYRNMLNECGARKEVA